jgi:hypothetical protein
MKVAHTDILFAVVGAPHSSDMTTSLLRLTDALLDRGATVQVWTCGYATMLTHSAHPEHKPRNVIDWSREHPTTATLVRELLALHRGRLHWYTCRFCSEERGLAGHIPEVGVRSPFKFSDHVRASGKTIFVGRS